MITIIGIRFWSTLLLRMVPAIIDFFGTRFWDHFWTGALFEGKSPYDCNLDFNWKQEK